MAYLDLPALRSALDYHKRALVEIRAIAAQTARDIGALDRKQLSESFLRERSTQIRQDGMEKARVFMQKNATLTRLPAVQAAKKYWTTTAYLQRAPMIAGGKDQLLETLTRLEWLARTSKMDTQDLSDALDLAIDRQEWGQVACVAQEVRSRPQNDETAMLRARVLSLQPPDVAAAGEAIRELEQVDEFLGYAQRSIERGIASDTGLQMEHALRIGQERDAARADEQRH